VIVVVVIPVLLGLPAMLLAIPPLVVGFPAALAFGVQVAAAIFGFAAVFSIRVNGMIEPGFRLLDRVLTMRTIIGMSLWGRCHEEHKSAGDDCCYCCFSNSLDQSILLYLFLDGHRPSFFRLFNQQTR
jgi:hypothetical protein